MSFGSTLSRRVSEVLGVALFGAGLIWLVALASYEPSDPVWFFSTGAEAPSNFVGRVGAFLAELSFQIVGYGSFLLPAIVAIAGWHYFWCRRVEAVYTKVTGAVPEVVGTEVRGVDIDDLEPVEQIDGHSYPRIHNFAA
jgi:S-DNA-T family DNA segregation ATPase FtsK/SpoIIIE